MGDLQTLNDQFRTLLDSRGVGSDLLVEQLVSVVSGLILSVRDVDPDNGPSNDWEAGFDAGWSQGLSTIIDIYCDAIEVEATDG